MAEQNKLTPGILYGDTFQLPIAELDLRLENHRQVYSDETLNELKEAILNVGIINALTVIQHEGSFVLVSGWRRYKASLLANLSEVPVRIAQTDLEGAKLIQIIENCQREDVGPLEERDAFNEWVAMGKKPTEIAHMIGVSEKYVYQRIGLNRLIGDVEEVLASGGISLTVALEFCKITPERQKDLLFLISTPGMDVPYNNDIRAVRNFITSISTDLTKAYFDTTKEDLIPSVPACINCSKRSGCMKTLFPEITENDTCYDRECYRAKTDTAIDNKISEIRSKGGITYTVSETYLNHKSAQTNGFDYCLNHLDTEPADEIIPGEHYGIIKETPIHGNIGKMFRIVSDDPHPVSEIRKIRSAPQDPSSKARKMLTGRIANLITSGLIEKQPEEMAEPMLVWVGWSMLQKTSPSVAKQLAREFSLCFTAQDEKTFTNKDLEELGMDYALLRRMFIQTAMNWNHKRQILFISTISLYEMSEDIFFTKDDESTNVLEALAGYYGIDVNKEIETLQNETGIDLGILPF